MKKRCGVPVVVVVVVAFVRCFHGANGWSTPTSRKVALLRFVAPLKSATLSSISPSDNAFFDSIKLPSTIPAAPSGLLQGYERLCETKPLTTKSVTSAVVTAIGNLLSQAIRSSITVSAPFVPNFREASAYFLVGLLYIGPFYHWWFGNLWKMGDWMESRFGSSKSTQVHGKEGNENTLSYSVEMTAPASHRIHPFVCFFSPNRHGSDSWRRNILSPCLLCF